MHLYPINGKAQKSSNSNTPWANRDANYTQIIIGVAPDPANREKITDWAKNYWEALHPHSAGGAYVNFLMEEGQERIKATYKHNYKRLSKIKAMYDPDNIFHLNQNIQPSNY